ncbi:MAG: hypothetical protein HZA46_23200 [Planctomycetales bacterium]|nr:hypothetical protein [Planctomycetales bacterium]
MSLSERVWWLLTFGSVGWYLTVTIYVSVRGAFDIRHMLRRLDEQHSNTMVEKPQEPNA